MAELTDEMLVSHAMRLAMDLARIPTYRLRAIAQRKIRHLEELGWTVVYQPIEADIADAFDAAKRIIQREPDHG